MMRRLLVGCLGAALVGTVVSATELQPVQLGGPEVAKLDWGSRMMRVADFNADGRQDLVFINTDHASLDFLFQLAPGETKPAKPNIEPNRWEPVLDDARFRLRRVTTGDAMLELAVGDLNRDGRIDLAYTAEGEDSLFIQYQDENGDWTEHTPPLLPAASNLVGTLLLVDLDGDDRLDVVMASRDELAVLRQSDDGDLSPAIRYALPDEGVERLNAIDLNHDQRPDLLYLCRQDAREPIRVRLQRPDGHLGPELRVKHEDLGFSLEPSTGLPGQDPAADALNFLATGAREGRIEFLSLTLGSESAKYDEATDWAGPQVIKLKQAGRGTAAYAFGDFDGDGRVDLAVSDPDASESTIYLRGESGGFTQPLAFPSLTDVTALGAADADGDGRDELYLASNDESTVAAVEMNATGHIGYPRPIELEGQPVAMAVASTAPGSPPVMAVVATRERERWLLILQPGDDGAWTVQKELEIEDVRSAPEAVAFWDANQDDRLDIMVFVPREPVKLYLHLPDDTLQRVEAAAGFQRGLVEGLERGQCSFADVDDDGRPELLIVKDTYVRAVRLTPEHDFEVVGQFNSSDATAGLATALRLPAQSPTGESMLLFDRKNGRLEIQRAGERGVYTTTARHPADRLMMVDAQVRSSRTGHEQADEFFLLGRDRIWWFPFDADPISLQREVLYKTDLPDVSFYSALQGDLDQDGVDELVGIDPFRNLVEIVAWDGEAWRPQLHFKIFENASPANAQNQIASRQPREALLTDMTGDGRADLLLLVHDRLLLYPQQDPAAP